MTTEKDTGGPAFPVLQDGCQFPRSEGMTLRDHFAAQVIGHLIVSPLRQESSTDRDAHYAYAVADAMLKARQS